jgi:hypothetical protein
VLDERSEPHTPVGTLPVKADVLLSSIGKVLNTVAHELCHGEFGTAG